MDIALSGPERFLPTTIESHVVKIVITWSISPDENNNIGLVFYVVNNDLDNLATKNTVTLHQTCIDYELFGDRKELERF